MTKEEIVAYNKKLGIETRFFSDLEKLGYTKDNIIYLNEKARNLEKINLHELLHHYENSETFKVIKKAILKSFDEKYLLHVRASYLLKYYSLYKKEDIDKGILDTEIVIDFIIDNSLFDFKQSQELIEILKDERVIDHFLIKEKISNLLETRYLVMSLSQKIAQRFRNLNIWEKVFVANYYKKDLPSGNNRYEKVKADLKRELERLTALKDDSGYFKIDSSDNPYLNHEYESRIRILVNQGEEETANYYLNNEEEIKEVLAKKYAKSLQNEYRHIVNCLENKEYDEAFKVLMLNETLSKVYKQDVDGDIKTIIAKRIVHKSIAGQMILNDFVLDVIYKDYKNYSSFSKLYYSAVREFKQKISVIPLEGIKTFNKGRWLRFLGKTNNAQEYLNNAQKLSALVADTPWCTKILASSQLEQGDFYVFVDYDNKPHIAVKMDGNEVDEVRGILNGNDQEIEDEYRDVAIEFLNNNCDIQCGKEWIEKEEWNKRLVEYNKLFDSNKEEKIEIANLVKDLRFKDYRAHGFRNSHRDLLLARLKSCSGGLKEKIENYFGCNFSDIYFGNVRDYDQEFSNYKIIFGNININCSLKYADFKNLKKIIGNANFSQIKMIDLEYLEEVMGNINLKKCRVSSLDNLKFIIGNANFRDSRIESLSSLRAIGGNANFVNSLVDDLSLLRYIGGNANFVGSEISKIASLQRIEGDANFNDSLIEDLSALKYIGGTAYFTSRQLKSLTSLERIGGDIYVDNKRIKDMDALKLLMNNYNFRV